MNTSRHVKIRHRRQETTTRRLFLNPVLRRFFVTIFFATGLLATVLFVTSSPSSARAADEHWVWAAQHAVGSRLPDFTAKDSQGKKQRLSALLGKHGTLVLFNRSADW